MTRDELLGGEARRRLEDADLVDNELRIMGNGMANQDPAARQVAIQRLALGGDPGPAVLPEDQKPPPGFEAMPQSEVDNINGTTPAPSSAPAPMPAPMAPPKAAPSHPALAKLGLGAPPAPAPEPEGPSVGSRLLSSLNMTPEKADRVSEALYSAATRKPLEHAFFAEPANDRMRAEELAQKKQHNDFLKEQLRLKYGAKAGALSPEDYVANSDSSKIYKAGLRGNPALKSIIDKMDAMGAFDSASKAQLMPLFGEAKQLMPVTGKVYAEDQKPGLIEARGDQARETEGVKQTGRKELQAGAFAHDTEKTAFVQGEANKRAQMNVDAAQSRFDQALDDKRDARTQELSQKIPKEAKAVFDSGARIDALVHELGGPGNLEGVGLIEGSVPNLAYEKPVMQLRHEINELVATWQHEKYGGSFTADEIKRADAAEAMVKGSRSEEEILDGVRQIRQIMQSKTDQAIGGASPEIRRRLFKYYSTGPGSAGLFGPTPEGATAPSPSPSIPAPPIDTTTQATEPTGAQLDSLAKPGAPPKVIRVPPPKATTPDKGQKSPNGLDYVKSKVKGGRRYFIDAANKIVDSVVDNGG